MVNSVCSQDGVQIYVHMGKFMWKFTIHRVENPRSCFIKLES